MFRPRTDPAVDWRPLGHEDLGDLDRLMTAIEEADDLAGRHLCEDLYTSYTAAGPAPAYETLVGHDRAGTLVAYGWNHPQQLEPGIRRVLLTGGVHPEHRRRGNGHDLLERQLALARTDPTPTATPSPGARQLVAYADERLLDQGRLYEELGLRPIRWYADLAVTFDGPLPEHAAPEGIRIVPFSRKRFADVRAAHDESFADLWGVKPVDSADWEKQLLRPESRLSWSWVALAAETSEVVGYATSSAYEQDWYEQGFSEGWTDRLGVRKAWRGQGIAQALLCASMHSFADAGLGGAGLGVDSDSPSGAVDPYRSLGYRSTSTVVMYARSEPSPGPVS